jgi:hypothetical protein
MKKIIALCLTLSISFTSINSYGRGDGTPPFNNDEDQTLFIITTAVTTGAVLVAALLMLCCRLSRQESVGDRRDLSLLGGRSESVNSTSQSKKEEEEQQPRSVVKNSYMLEARDLITYARNRMHIMNNISGTDGPSEDDLIQILAALLIENYRQGNQVGYYNFLRRYMQDSADTVLAQVRDASGQIDRIPPMAGLDAAALDFLSGTENYGKAYLIYKSVYEK